MPYTSLFLLSHLKVIFFGFQFKSLLEQVNKQSMPHYASVYLLGITDH